MLAAVRALLEEEPRIQAEVRDAAKYYPEDDEYLLAFEPTVTHYEVSLSREYSSDLLTERQLQVATEVLANGYYDTPRRCTLTDLAAELGVSKATASNVLHRAEEKMVKEFFGDVPTPDRDR